MKPTALFFGTFNPVHIGHLILANHILQYAEVAEVLFVVTPHNPLKKKRNLLNNHERYNMVWNLCEDYPGLRPEDIEFSLPQPNYTAVTLNALEEKYPGRQFQLVMGEDNLKSFKKWRNYEFILENYPILVYPRFSEGEVPQELFDAGKITYVKAPRVEISSTAIRKAIRAGKDVRPLLPEKVWRYIDERGIYR